MALEGCTKYIFMAMEVIAPVMFLCVALAGECFCCAVRTGGECVCLVDVMCFFSLKTILLIGFRGNKLSF